MRSVRILALRCLLLAACAHAPPPPAPAAAQVAKPTPPPAPVPAPEPVAAPVPPAADIAPASVYFAFDSSELTPSMRIVLQTFFDQAQRRPDRSIRIEGNCDERGTREYNLALGQRRADAAKKYLVDLGLEASRVTAISNGKERPRAAGDDEAAWKENRRDDLLPASGDVREASR